MVHRELSLALEMARKVLNGLKSVSQLELELEPETTLVRVLVSWKWKVERKSLVFVESMVWVEGLMDLW